MSWFVSFPFTLSFSSEILLSFSAMPSAGKTHSDGALGACGTIIAQRHANAQIGMLAVIVKIAAHSAIAKVRLPILPSLSPSSHIQFVYPPAPKTSSALSSTQTTSHKSTPSFSSRSNFSPRTRISLSTSGSTTPMDALWCGCMRWRIAAARGAFPVIDATTNT